jgi:putative NADPH-quinone reductase
MSRKVLVINGHPQPGHNGLCPALAAHYEAGCRQAGHETRRLDVGSLTFDLLRSQGDFERATPPADIAGAQEAVRWADHLVVIFPLWLGDMPALLKGFFEQVLRPGFAFAYRPSGFPEKLLAGRSARIVITMGMPALAYRWFYLAHSLKSLQRNILGFVGFAPVRSTLIGSVGTFGEQGAKRWLDRMTVLGRRAA